MIGSSIKEVQKRIVNAALRSGRKAQDITLVAVVKGRTSHQLQDLISCGITIFGENKAQELVSHYQEFQTRVKWHFIGHLQTNKINQVINRISLLQSLDSLGLAQEIEKKLVQQNKRLDVLIEINSAKEPQKSGILPDEVYNLLKLLKSFKYLRVKGFMTMGKLTNNREASRDSFKLTKRLFDEARSNYPKMSVLSMGMSNDFEIAIEEGATMIRIGRSLFTKD